MNHRTLHRLLFRAAVSAAALSVGISAVTMSGCGGVSQLTDELSRVISDEFNQASEASVPSKAPDLSGTEESQSSQENKKGATYTMADIANLQNVDYFGEATLEHIFDGTINRNGKATGYHYTMVLDSKGEVVEGTRSKPDKNGVFTAKVRVSGIDKNGFSSFYPESWTPQQVVDAINTAYEDAITNSANPTASQLWIGHYGDLEIDMYLDDARQIVTAYPIYQG